MNPDVYVSFDVPVFVADLLEWLSDGQQELREQLLQQAVAFRLGQLSVLNPVEKPYRDHKDVYRDSLVHYLRHLLEAEGEEEGLRWFDEHLIATT